MKRRLLLLIVAALCAWVPVAYSRDTDPANDVVEMIERSIRQGDVGWWQESADPTIRAIGTYTGLGSDITTLLTVDSLDELLPGWSKVGTGFDAFGYTFAVYSIASDAASGDYDAATMTGVKTLMSMSLKKFVAGGGVAAAGLGVLDAMLTYMGEAAHMQIHSDFWDAYVNHQFVRYDGLEHFLTTFERGGFDALGRELDGFWTYEGTAAIKGITTLKTVDPDHVEHFRNRFIKEYLLHRIEEWAEQKQREARAKLYVDLLTFFGSLDATEVSIRAPVRLMRLDAPAEGFTVELKYGATVLGRAMSEDGFAEIVVPLSRLMIKGRLIDSLSLRASPPGGVEGGPAHGYLRLREHASYERKSSRGRITLTLRQPISVDPRYAVSVRATGDLAAMVRSAYFIEYVPSRASQPAATHQSNDSRTATISMRGGTGSGMIPAGLYRIRYLGDFSGRFHAPETVTIDRAMAITFTTRSPQADAPVDVSMPSLDPLTAAFDAFVTGLGDATRPRVETIAEFAAAQRAYWQDAARAEDAFYRAVASLEMKRKTELAASGLSNAQRRTISQKYDSRINALRSGHSRFWGQVSTAANNLSERVSQADREIDRLREDADREYRTAVSSLSQLSHTANESIIRIGQGFERISRERQGEWVSSSTDEFTSRVDDQRQRVASGEQKAIAAERAYDSSLSRIEELSAARERAYERIGRTADIHTRPIAEARDRHARVAAVVDTHPTEEARRQTEALLRRRQRHEEGKKKLRRLVESIIETMKGLPAIDDEAWAMRTESFSGRYRAIVEKLGNGEDPGAEAVTSLRADLDAWFDTQQQFVGDLLPEPKHSRTPFSDYSDLYAEVNPGAYSRFIDRDWWQRFRTLANAKVGPRFRAVRPLVALSANVDLLVALSSRGYMPAAVTAVNTRVADLINPDAPVAPSSFLERLIDARASLDTLPVELRHESDLAWDAARTRFVTSGEYQRVLEGSGKPYLIVVSVNGMEWNRPYWWPSEVQPRRDGGSSAELVVAVAGAPDEAFTAVRFSYNEGRTWRMLPRTDGGYSCNVTAGRPPSYYTRQRVSGIVSGGRELARWDILPLIRVRGTDR